MQHHSLKEIADTLVKTENQIEEILAEIRNDTPEENIKINDEENLNDDEIVKDVQNELDAEFESLVNDSEDEDEDEDEDGDGIFFLLLLGPCYSFHRIQFTCSKVSK